MSLLEILPILAALGFVVYNSRHLASDGSPSTRSWILPAALSLVFLLFSLFSVAAEGLSQFWINHTRTYVGNQVWFDLLLAISIGFSFMAPEARRLGMRPALWLVAICLTGCVALLAMLARIFWIKARLPGPQASQVS